jgi:hypothetical protein
MLYMAMVQIEHVVGNRIGTGKHQKVKGDPVSAIIRRRPGLEK